MKMSTDMVTPEVVVWGTACIRIHSLEPFHSPAPSQPEDGSGFGHQGHRVPHPSRCKGTVMPAAPAPGAGLQRNQVGCSWSIMEHHRASCVGGSLTVRTAWHRHAVACLLQRKPVHANDAPVRQACSDAVEAHVHKARLKPPCARLNGRSARRIAAGGGARRSSGCPRGPLEGKRQGRTP